MHIENTTRKKIIAKNATPATKWKDKTIGLIGTKTPHALILHTHFGIHTLGMKYPIDVLVLNKQQKVVAIKENLTPNSVFLWNPLYSTVIELPSGVIKSSETHKGDQLLLV